MCSRVWSRIWCRHRRWPVSWRRCWPWCFVVVMILVDVRVVMVLSYIAIDWILRRFPFCRIHCRYWINRVVTILRYVSIDWILRRFSFCRIHRRYWINRWRVIRSIVNWVSCRIRRGLCLSRVRCRVFCWIRCGPLISRIWRGFVRRPLCGNPSGISRRLLGWQECRIGSRP